MESISRPNYTLLVTPPDEWSIGFRWLAAKLVDTVRVHRGQVHATDVSSKPEYATYELHGVTVICPVLALPSNLAEMMKPNLPWANDHFAERVSGHPMNPAPSHEWWPYAQSGNAGHTDEKGRFSHTYPERFWPRFANIGEIRSNGRQVFVPHNGIRFEYGDLNDVVNLIKHNPFTRQAYLPVWFPEDTGANSNQRVPCSLGYHFIRNGQQLDCHYFLRSCDFVRHFTDDAYLAGRLLQWVVGKINETGKFGDFPLFPGQLTMTISNLHAFAGDEQWLRKG